MTWDTWRGQQAYFCNFIASTHTHVNFPWYTSAGGLDNFVCSVATFSFRCVVCYTSVVVSSAIRSYLWELPSDSSPRTPPRWTFCLVLSVCPTIRHSALSQWHETWNCEPGSSVSIVSGYGMDDRQRRNDFSSSLCVQTGSGAHPTSCTVGTEGPFPGGKARPGRDADDTSSSAEVDNEQELYLLSP
jgi:hypothetical protein